jgi:anti-anti-sigma factor
MQMLLTRPQESVVQATVIQPEGSLTAHNAGRFHDQLNMAVLSSPHSSLLVDMTPVDSIDRDGLMALVNAYKLAKRSNKGFYLCSVSRTVQMILELTQLDKVLEIVESPAVFLNQSL